MTVVRDREAKALISLGMDALSEALHMGHELHSAIYDNKASTSNAELQDTLAEVLTCMERAEHYLLMLGSNFEENSPARRRWRRTRSVGGPVTGAGPGGVTFPRPGQPHQHHPDSNSRKR